MLSRMFRGKVTRVEPLDYEDAKNLIQDPDPDIRRAVARRQDVRPEILYYLAEDKEPLVRREIAANPAAPLQADLLLASDEDDEVRYELARKIGRLLPNLSRVETTRLRELTIETLETLASDALPRVRAELAEVIKTSRLVPRELVLRLARDIEEIVSAPVLEYSPLLSEHDLLEIIRSGIGPGALTAIARRSEVSENVADALATTRDIAAVAALLGNPSAQIREETLDMIADQAEGIEAWHQPLASRPEISVRAMRRISQFVASSILATLASRHGLPEDIADELRRAVGRRMESEGKVQDVLPSRKTAVERVADAVREGRLDDALLCDAIEAGDRAFVHQALAVASGLGPETVQKICESRAPKAIAALAWKAGFSMRTAIRLQVRVAGVPPQSVLYARQGIHYPMSEEELQWQIDYFIR
ncbi:MAG: DUF2336 domain-containing protein [Alphaproteobacteria bacterium]|nr:DUF2336 domain-containing protein [Alphaproteobacteria bacterium]